MALTRPERDALVASAIDADDKRFPEPPTVAPQGRAAALLAEQFYVAIGDYFDGLPRITMSVCPFCAEPLRRAFDPWGLDGAWWGENDICTYSEPGACEHFRVLLGAVRIAEGDVPARTVMQSQPGPTVPFVVPRMLELETMVAVVGELAMETGGPAFPIAYFSETPIADSELHQMWRRTMFWYLRDGKESWSARNDVWDFDLAPWVGRDKLQWVTLSADDPLPLVQKASDTLPDGSAPICPFVDLAGERQPQVVIDGDRDFLPAPNGAPLNPFEEEA